MFYIELKTIILLVLFVLFVLFINLNEPNDTENLKFTLYYSLYTQ
jgi:hypothetical protein